MKFSLDVLNIKSPVQQCISAVVIKKIREIATSYIDHAQHALIVIVYKVYTKLRESKKYLVVLIVQWNEHKKHP